MLSFADRMARWKLNPAGPGLRSLDDRILPSISALMMSDAQISCQPSPSGLIRNWSGASGTRMVMWLRMVSFQPK